MAMTWPDFPDVTNNNPRIVVRDISLIVAPILDWTIVGCCYYVFKRSIGGSYGSPEEQQPLRQDSIRSSVGSSFTPFSGQGRKLA